MSQPILIMGATSGIGAAALDEAVGRGLAVRAFARSAKGMAHRDLVEPFAGDALDRETVTEALAGTRAVIFALGIKERLSMLWEEETLFSESTRVLISAMAVAGPKRLVAVTGFGSGRSKMAMSTIERMGHSALMGKPYADKDRQEELIFASELDWTIVRPVILTNSTTSQKPTVLRAPSRWRNGLISRAAVANYLIDAIEHDLDKRADVVLTR